MHRGRAALQGRVSAPNSGGLQPLRLTRDRYFFFGKYFFSIDATTT